VSATPFIAILLAKSDLNRTFAVDLSMEHCTNSPWAVGRALGRAAFRPHHLAAVFG